VDVYRKFIDGLCGVWSVGMTLSPADSSAFWLGRCRACLPKVWLMPLWEWRLLICGHRSVQGVNGSERRIVQGKNLSSRGSREGEGNNEKIFH